MHPSMKRPGPATERWIALLPDEQVFDIVQGRVVIVEANERGYRCARVTFREGTWKKSSQTTVENARDMARMWRERRYTLASELPHRG